MKKNSIDGEAFDSACETISFYLTRGRIEEARAVLKVIPFVPISLSEKEIENIIQEYKKKGPLLTSFAFILAINNKLIYRICRLSKHTLHTYLNVPAGYNDNCNCSFYIYSFLLPF